MKFNKLIFLMVVVIAIIWVATCTHDPELVAPPDLQPWVNAGPCDPDSIYFWNTIAPMLNQFCGSTDCHDHVDPEDDIDVSTYASILSAMDGEFVVPYNLNNSELWDVITQPASEEDHMPPSDRPQLSSDQKNDLALWITQGARYNACIADCDTSVAVKFAGVVFPIIQSNCIGCHGSSNPSGSVSLTNYNQVFASANSGQLMNSLLGQGGQSIMPDNTTGLPQCMIDQIQQWVNSGMAND